PVVTAPSARAPNASPSNTVPSARTIAAASMLIVVFLSSCAAVIAVLLSPLCCAVDDDRFTVEDRVADLAAHRSAHIGHVAAARGAAAVVDRPAQGRVDHAEVGRRALGDQVALVLHAGDRRGAP